MDEYTVASVGPYIVLLNAAERRILFSKKIYTFNLAGETTINDERYIVTIYDDNFIKFMPLDSLSIDKDFTWIMPNDIIMIEGIDLAYLKISSTKYIDLYGGYDYFIYKKEDITYFTSDYKTLRRDYEYNIIDCCAHSTDDARAIPFYKKYIQEFEFIDDSDIKLQIIVIDEKDMYFIPGEYIPNLCNDEGSPIIVTIRKGKILDKYYLNIESDGIFLVNLRSKADKIKLTTDITQAARPSNFSSIYKFPEPITLKCGEHRYGNIILNSLVKTEQVVELYSTVKTDGNKEIVFYIYENSDVIILDHKYVTPMATKAAPRE